MVMVMGEVRIVNELSTSMEHLEKLVEMRDIETQATFDEGRKAIEDLKTLVQGNKGLRVKGVMVRLETLEDTVTVIVRDRRSERDKLKGIQIGLGITTLTGISTLIAVISQIFN